MFEKLIVIPSYYVIKNYNSLSKKKGGGGNSEIVWVIHGIIQTQKMPG